MGIVNITDDSFFGGSRCIKDGRIDMNLVRSRVADMIEDGASIIDFGACSTRPGSASVSEDEELRRLRPVLGMMVREFPEVCVSVDTFRSSVVKMAAGILASSLAPTPLIVNDISAGEDDAEMLATVGALGLPYIAMHKRGVPANMQEHCDYPEGVLKAVDDYFDDFALRAEINGIKEWILDPGFGFSKTIDQNYELLRGMERLARHGRPILVGVSRKSMIYRLFGTTPDESLPETQVLHFAALQRGASILRVHDVREAVHTIEMFRRLGV